jgi:hypothetical protein
MPTAGLLRAVFQSVMIERGYGVFVGPVTCDEKQDICVYQTRKQHI